MAKHYSVEEKIEILSFLDKGWGITEVAQYHSLSTSTVKRWRHQYQLKGIGGLKQRKYTHFSQEFKQKVVLEYLSTDTSLPFLRDKYNISNESV
ncbi:helix-turn-helix domain-containing protein, partial [Amylolactobacillus amylophilus]